MFRWDTLRDLLLAEGYFTSNQFQVPDKDWSYWRDWTLFWLNKCNFNTSDRIATVKAMLKQYDKEITDYVNLPKK